MSRPIKLRQPCEFDRQSVAAIGRPIHGDTAPGILRRNRLREDTIGIEREALGEFAPGLTEARGRPRSDQVGKFAGAYQEAAAGIDLPDKAQRVQMLLERRLFGP